jgi:hypothetical protein
MVGGDVQRRFNLAVLAGASALLLVFLAGYFVQNSIVPREEDLDSLHFFWLKFVAGPLTLATFMGVLLSRVEKDYNAVRFRAAKIIILPAVVAFCTFIFAYLLLLALWGNHFTPVVVDAILISAYVTAVPAVRISVNFLFRSKKA